MFENRMQSRIFGRMRKEVKVGCSKLQYTEFHNFKTLVRKTRMYNFDKTLKITSPTVPAGRDSTIGIALEGPGIEFRWGARLSTPVQTGAEAHPDSYTMGTGSFPGVRCGRRVVFTTHLM
jgi:hypothetical protein